MDSHRRSFADEKENMMQAEPLEEQDFKGVLFKEFNI